MPITEAFSESLIAHPVYTWTLLIVAVQGIVSFALLWFFTAPYGRHVRAGWGPTMKARTVWVFMEALSPIACANHRWYIEHFNDYPKNRLRLIPFLL